MADESTGTPRMWCPFCLTTVDDLEICPTCGLLQVGLMPARLRDIVVRLHAISDEQTTLGVEQSALADERVRLLADIRGEPAPGSPPVAVRSYPEPPAAVAGDWRPERVRDALLWLGAVLLALSAITFAIVAWARLDPAGRAALLLGATAVAGGSAFGLRNRLRATAEALTGLTLALALVDWYVLRRAGLGENLDVATWWAIGTALIGGLSFGTAGQLRLRSARLGAALLGLTSAAFAVGATTSELWATAAACALVAGLAVVVATVADRTDWRDVSVVLVGGCVGFELVALGFAGAAVTDIATTADAFGPAISFLALGLAPAFAAAFADERRRSGTAFDLLVGLAVAAVIGAPVVFLSAELGATGLAAFAAGVGVLAVASGRVAPPRLRLGPAGAGATAIAVALAVVASRVVLAVVGPLDWFSDAWSGSLRLPAAEHFSPTDPTILTDGWATVAVLLAVAIAVVAACARPSWRAPLTASVPGAAEVPGEPIIIGALVGAIAVALPASGASIRTALAFELSVAVALVAFAVVLDARRPALGRWLLGGAAVVLVTAAGWGVVEPSATITVLAVVTIVAGLAGLGMQTVPSRIALLMVAGAAGVAEAGVVTGTITDALGPAGFAVAAAAGAVLLVGALGRKAAVEGPELEAVGLVGLVVGLGLCSESVVWVAGTLTVSTVALGGATLRRDRGGYAWLTAAAAVGSLWAWLAAAEVSVLEAYTVPAALVLLGAGLVRRRADHDVGSWAAYGPGLVLGLGPSLLVALDRGGSARPIGVIAASVACVLVGSRRGLRAPLTLGAVALVAIAVENLGPVAAQVPRWLALGAIGLLMLWLGASAERRLNQLRRWRTALKQLT